MTPMEWAVRPLKKYADFTGRAGRAEYWWYYLGTIIAGIPLRIFDNMFGLHEALQTIFDLGIFLPTIAVTVRRLHDTNRSGAWLLLFVAAFAIIGFVAVAMGFNWHPAATAPFFTSLVVAIVLILGASVTFLVFMVLPGTEGPNYYGPDPYGPDQLEEVFA